MRPANSNITPHLKRPLAPSNDQTSDSALPPRKRRRTEDAVPKPGLALTTLQQRARDTITQRLRADPIQLDLSDLNAGDLMTLPASLLGAAASQISRLHLPRGLLVLPPICYQMPALRYLHLPEFAGTMLNLENVGQLERVDGSGSVRLEAVYADVRTDLAINIRPGLRKVRVHRYADGRFSRTHGLPGQTYLNIPPGSLTPIHRQLNGKARFVDNGQIIWCRHICQHVVEAWPASRMAGTKEHHSFAGIASATDLSARLSSEINSRYGSALLYSKAYAFVDEQGFGKFAADQLQLLMHIASDDSATHKSSQSYYLASNNHVTALFLTAKATTPPVFKAMLVDPNYYLAQTRIEANSLEAIRDAARGWRLNQMFHPSALASYTNPSKPALMYAFSTHRRPPNQPPSVGIYMKNEQSTNVEFIYSAMSLGLQNLLATIFGKLQNAYENDEISGAALFPILAARSFNGRFGLDSALSMGQVNSVREFTAAVERLASTPTCAHLLNISPDGLPDHWCQTLLTTKMNWCELALGPLPDIQITLPLLINAWQRLFESRQISAAACLAELAKSTGNHSNGWNVIDAAAAKKDAALLSALEGLLVALHKSGAASRERCAQLVKDPALLDRWIPPEPQANPEIADDPGIDFGFDLLVDPQVDNDFSISW